ncbi:glyoxal oxidase [Herbidospora galbida]|uniref:glyoxal oxidase n=1 Tax=Herbidospora galbida TaxID=2575442 RepID=UPI0014857AA7|nr:glyoxal oxidase [Herbidospora galbida]
MRIYIGSDPHPIADTTVDWADTFVAVDQSRLVPNQLLRATQQRPGEPESPRSERGEIVEKAFNGKVAFTTPFVCAQALHVQGCCPGGELEVLQGGVLLGHAQAATDEVTITFDAGERVGSGQKVEVRQRICGSPATVSTISGMPTTPPWNDDQQLPTPSLVEPLEECVGLVTVTGIVPGAVLRLRREGSTVFDSPVAHSTMSIRIAPLQLGERFETDQIFQLCKSHSQADTGEVVKLQSLLPPRIDGPMCKTAQKLTLSRLKPAATVILMANGTEIGRWQAGAASMPVDIALPAGATLTARQELCGIVSPVSRGRRVTFAGGRWFRVEDEKGKDLLAKSFAIHVALTNTGKIVIFSGDKHSKPTDLQDVNQCELFDCASLTLKKIDAPTSDVFCSGHAFLSDGRLLVAGGTESWPTDSPDPHGGHFGGLKDAWMFNPRPGEGKPHWSREQPMKGGRWYPTLLTLHNGIVLALSGHPDDADAVRHQNNTMEVWAGDGWTQLGDTDAIDIRREPPAAVPPLAGYLYPRIFSGPRGEVFSATPIAAELSDPPQLPRASASWAGPAAGVNWTRNSRPPAGIPRWDAYEGFNMPATLLPLLEEEGFRFQVLLAGGAGRTSGWTIDLGTPAAPVSAPQWTVLGPRGQSNARARFNSNLVLLPSGEVLLCNGVEDGADDDTAVLEPEILKNVGAGWEWDQNAFPRAGVPRNYHSTALLMPDGRVFTGGGNIDAKPGGQEVRRLNLEIYEPWYVCRNRPRLLNVPDRVSNGQTLNVDVRGVEPIDRLALVRCGSATHAFNSDQRYIGLIAHEVEPGRYSVKIPSTVVAVPGYYLLYACTQDRVPSKGVFIRIGR